MSATWPPQHSTVEVRSARTASRWGATIEVEEVNGQWVALLDGDEVLTRAHRLDALAAAERLAKRRYRKAHPLTRSTDVAGLDDEPYRAVLRGD